MSMHSCVEVVSEAKNCESAHNRSAHVYTYKNMYSIIYVYIHLCTNDVGTRDNSPSP